MIRWLPIAGLLVVWVAILIALWITAPKYILDLRKPFGGNVMASNFPGRCADIARHYLGKPGKAKVTIPTLKYNDMIRQLQECVSQVQATGVPRPPGGLMP